MDLYKFDVSLLSRYDADILIGIDEAGRGPLAGPVAAAACVVSPSIVNLLYEVKDSKKLPPLKRKKIYEVIRSCGVRYGVAFVSSDKIDKTNILTATFEAMANAVKKLGVYGNTLVVVDGNRIIPGLKYRQIAVKSADDKSLAVACASIIAKVERDEFMEKIDKIYPAYGFAKHKGYGTRQHYKALEKLGSCPYHRKTFCLKK